MTTGATLPYRTTNAMRPASAPRNGPSGGRVGRRCAYCGKRLPANGKALYCRDSCRVSMSRHKRRSCAALLVAALGMPKAVADTLLTRYGLPAIEQKLNALGWYWRAQDREWVTGTEHTQTARAA